MVPLAALRSTGAGLSPLARGLSLPRPPPCRHLPLSPLVSALPSSPLSSSTAGHQFEFLKINKQTTNDPYLTILRRITSTKGVIGLLDGFFPWGLMQAVCKGSVFAWGQAASMTLLHDVSWMDREQKVVLSGGMGGLVQGVVLSPLLLLKTRVMTDPSFRSSGGLVSTAIDSAKVGARLIRSEGVSALMKGAGMFSLKRAADWTTRYMFVVMVENWMRASPGAALSAWEEGTASILGGSISALSTIPLDVIVSTMQQASKAGKKVSVIEMFAEQAKAGGLSQVLAFSTRGLMVRVLHASLTTFMMKFVTTKVYDAVVRGKEEAAAAAPSAAAK